MGRLSHFQFPHDNPPYLHSKKREGWDKTVTFCSLTFSLWTRSI